ncbi:hypothetical protein JK361_26485 [Streptomyces sp. 5-8]|uniref:Uncharacterized protein n=1 Tax=Streptomyces musisoli TaxID=2802280 RepID=A0ABS1P6V2_9ACTN|nr:MULTISPECIES: hypothetical protein [Streptomyces]MBL1108096.1 hypothetical protein [Streptomyces musisoli]MBY8841460.1 hypothetical protein [Streptomyces sp. SP2-10]
MRGPRGRTDLVAFLAVLLTGVILVLTGIPPEAVSTVAIGLSTLYAAWRGERSSGGRGPGGRDPGARDG